MPYSEPDLTDDKRPDHRYVILIVLISLCAAVHFRNLFSELFDYDSSLYAEIAREMYRKHDFLHLTQKGQPFLDKPYMLFWLSAWSYSIFGISGWAYKLPSFISLIGTLIAVYVLCKNYYGKLAGLYAACITASSLGIFLMTNDVRTDALLTCFIFCGVACFSTYTITTRFLYLGLSALFFAAAYYTKGALGFIIPALALGPHVWRYFGFRYSIRALLMLVPMLLLLLIPLFCIAFFQFGWEGVRFFAWDHIAGRLSGSSFQNSPDPFYLWHTMLWVIAPWTILLVVQIASLLLCWWRGSRALRSMEIINISGLLLSLCVLSLSAFQLSHYVYPLIPFAAIQVASGFEVYQRSKPLKYIQIGAHALLLSAAALALFYLTPATIVYILAFAVLVLVYFYLVYTYDLLISTAMAAIVLNFVLSFVFFPAILKYQPNRETAEFIKEKKISVDNFVTLNVGVAYQLIFYSDLVPAEYYDITSLHQSESKLPLYILTNQDGYQGIKAAGWQATVEKSLYNFRLTKLTGKFINPATREDACEKYYLLKVESYK